MKRYRVKPSSAGLTTIRVSGKPHHFFHSEALGKCRAIIISEEENLPSAPGQALNDLRKGLPELFAESDPWDEYFGETLITDRERLALLYQELTARLNSLRYIDMNDHSGYAEALSEISLLRDRIWELEENGS